jgi:type VI secretion system secreted protein VgrG
MAITQKNRKIQVITTLGEDALLFYKMQGGESLSELFEYNLELLSENPSILPEDLLGNNITVSLELEDGSQRYFNGHITRFGQTGDQNDLSRYRVTVRPWLWFLTRSANCRIFQFQSVPEIIKQVFTDQGFSDFKDKLGASYAAREYCVQYRETDFNFVSRLMEEEGIYYYFSHENGKHFLVLSDAVNSHEKFPGYAEIRYHPERGSTDRSRTDHIHDWEFAREVQPGNYELTDYDFKKPKANLLVKSKIKQAHTRAEHEYFDYPGRYTETAVGDQFVRQRIEEHHARFDRCQGQCNARGLAVGYLFTLTEFPREDQNLQYLVTSASYYLHQDDYSSNGGGEEGFFDCSFSALDSKRPFRPSRRTAKPFVHGSQTAFVVGPKGEEIYTDQYGRVKVQFHWDRYGKVDENSSCWIRVSHPWAGKNWGMVAIPRIGHEVVVEFLEGDPDQPLIVGSVYNADTMPPYTLPGNKTQSGIKSRSSKTGTPDNFNEFRFEDKKGEEQVYLHAEKNYDIVVENNETHSVGADRTKTVSGNETAHVKKQRNHSVDKAEIISIGENQNISVGTTYTLEVKDQITLKCGASTITMNSGGEITIDGVVVTVNGSSKIDLNP